MISCCALEHHIPHLFCLLSWKDGAGNQLENNCSLGAIGMIQIDIYLSKSNLSHYLCFCTCFSFSLREIVDFTGYFMDTGLSGTTADNSFNVLVMAVSSLHPFVCSLKNNDVPLALFWYWY